MRSQEVTHLTTRRRFGAIDVTLKGFDNPLQFEWNVSNFHRFHYFHYYLCKFTLRLIRHLSTSFRVSGHVQWVILRDFSGKNQILPSVFSSCYLIFPAAFTTMELAIRHITFLPFFMFLHLPSSRYRKKIRNMQSKSQICTQNNQFYLYAIHKK